MRSTSKRRSTEARTAARSRLPHAATAATASSTLPTRKPPTPSRTISGIDPRALAMTGVPQAMASTTLKPKGSSNSMRWSRARAPPSSAPRASGPTGPT